MRPAGVRDCGHDLSRDADPTDGLVRGGVADDHQKHGISALGLKRTLGIGSEQTAWAMLHRYRTAMVRPGRERLSGIVEADETFLAVPSRACAGAALRGR